MPEGMRADYGNETVAGSRQRLNQYDLRQRLKRYDHHSARFAITRCRERQTTGATPSDGEGANRGQRRDTRRPP